MTVKIMFYLASVLLLSCNRTHNSAENSELQVVKQTSQKETNKLEHKYNCDVTILEKRTKMDKKSEKENLLGLVFLWKLYANIINEDRAYSKQYLRQLLTSIQENKMNKAKASCDSLIAGNQKNLDFISKKNKGEEFEHFEKLLYCYYQIQSENYKMYQSILLENSNYNKKYEQIYDLLNNSLDSDDKNWNELYEEYDILPKKHGFDKLKKAN